MNARIRLLPEHLIDQIKAGEVIERPANVLKELVENALDAGATKIDVEIRENGLSLLRITDNGRGIAPEDIELAFGRHATSKIERFEDLYRLSSFGFRGEALPSIASVSRMECVSWKKESSTGATIRYEGGLSQGVHSAQKTGLDHGTIMTVRDLFYNTPVRLKFLQSTTAEKNWLKRFFYAFVLAYPEVSFTLQWDDSERQLYPATGERQHAARIRSLFSPKAGPQIGIVESEREWQGLRCKVILISDGNHRPDGPLEHVLINRRAVLDKSFPRVALQVLEKYWPGLLPSIQIHFDLPGDQVDVNVHPNKTVVKFHQQGEIFAMLTATLRECLPQQEAQRPLATQGAMNTETPHSDIPRDREGVYTQHRENFSRGDSLGESPSSSTWEGPYFIHETASKVFYVDGKALLKFWVGLKMSHPAESTPLLVSFPLRDQTLSPHEAQALVQAGFELDELEKGFWVIRALPIYLSGMPLAQAMEAALFSAGVKGASLSDFAYESMSLGKWKEIWNESPLDSIVGQRLAIELGPGLFGRSKT